MHIVYNKMKSNERKNIISSIQQNLKEMRQQAQQYIDKHKSNLPPICTARHYLFHTLEAKSQCQSIILFKPLMVSKVAKEGKDKLKQPQKQGSSLPKRTICNLELSKKSTPTNSNLNCSMQEATNNSTSTKLRMGLNWRTSRYLKEEPSKNSAQTIESSDKIKNVLMNSQNASKDNKSNHNFIFTSRIPKQQMAKRDIHIVRKEFDIFKQTQSEQLKRQIPSRTEQKVLETKNTNKTEQKYLPKQVYIIQQNMKNIRIRRQRKKTTENPQIYGRQKIQSEIKTIPVRKKLIKKQYDVTEGDCTPWVNNYTTDQSYTCDFS